MYVQFIFKNYLHISLTNFFFFFYILVNTLFCYKNVKSINTSFSGNAWKSVLHILFVLVTLAVVWNTWSIEKLCIEI